MAFYRNKERFCRATECAETNKATQHIVKIDWSEQPFTYILNYRIPEGWLNIAIIVLLLFNLYKLCRK